MPFPLSPPQNDPAPKWGRTLYEVLHGVHTNFVLITVMMK